MPHLTTADKISKVSEDHKLHLQQVMGQRLLVIRKQALLRWKTNTTRLRYVELKSTASF